MGNWKCAGSLITLLVSLLLNGCAASGTSTTEDSSTSGSVASAIGGAISGTSGGTSSALERHRQSLLSEILRAAQPWQDAYASTACPTWSTPASGCSVNSNVMTLTYGTTGCSFGTSTAVWTGSQTITTSSGNPACGTLPTSSYNGTITRAFADGTARTSASSIAVAITTSSTIGNALDGGAYNGGTITTLSSGTRTAFDIPGISLVASKSSIPLFSHLITTNSSAGGAQLTFTGGNTLNGKVATFHNLAKVKAISTISNAVFSPSTCCTPISGTISTVFSAISGVTPTTIGAKLVAAGSESLTFTACGAGTYTGPDGTTGSVTFSHCF